jgi:hypothetical protein
MKENDYTQYNKVTMKLHLTNANQQATGGILSNIM